MSNIITAERSRVDNSRSAVAPQSLSANSNDPRFGFSRSEFVGPITKEACDLHKGSQPESLVDAGCTSRPATVSGAQVPLITHAPKPWSTGPASKKEEPVTPGSYQLMTKNIRETIFTAAFLFGDMSAHKEQLAMV
ncbi:MAG TPA: hypothetical protein VMT55_05780 [Candidatus Sulfotelmatobacter sp.]|nr:hypothetical protein [Candidatus Sulfotelmatobacter sp.]